MTKAIEDELNLPRIADALKALQEESDENDHSIDDIKTALSDISALKQELKSIDNFDDNETKLDELQDSAIQAHKELLEAGFSVEPKNAGNFLESAAQHLNLAIDAEKQKIDRKMKLLKMRMDEQRLELERDKLELNRRKVDIAEKQLLGDTAEVIDTSDGSFRAKREEILRMIEESQDENK